METMQDVINRLKAQRAEHAKTVDRIDKAIELLGSDNASHGTTTNGSAPRTMSLAARRKISIAMKARHAKARNAAARGVAPKKLHWTQTPQGRKKFAAIRAKANRKAA